MQEVEKVIQTCDNILKKVRGKSKEEVNPLLYRIQLILEELKRHLLESQLTRDIQPLKYHWSVIYRDGDMLDEMTTLIKNTTPLMIETEVDYIKQTLSYYAEEIIQLFGRKESFYIITPKFQELSGIWK